MTNNDVMRRLRYIFDYGDAQMITLFALGGEEVTRADVSDWLRRDDDPDGKDCSDVLLATFLNGLIVAKRGRRKGPLPVPEERLSNNAIFVKLKIALGLRAEEVVDILALAGHPIGKPELSAFFRGPEHRQYRECQDQVLRKFLQGLQLQHRDPQHSPPPGSGGDE